MKEFIMGEFDKKIIANYKYNNLDASKKLSHGNAPRYIFLHWLDKQGIKYEHVKGNTYIISTPGGGKKMIVIASYGNLRKTKSYFTVGKEVADSKKQELEYPNWYAVFVTFTSDLNIEKITVGKDAELELSEHRRSSGVGIYHACSKKFADDKLTDFNRWYYSL